MPPDVWISLLVSAGVPWVLERLKGVRQVPFIQPYAPTLNRLTAVGVSIVTALGVSVSFDPAVGVLTVAGLLPDQMVRVGLQAFGNFIVQEIVYRGAVHRPGPYA